MDVTAIVLEATLPVVQVIIKCTVGAICRKLGLLNDAGLASLNKLIYFVYVPALIFGALGGSVTAQTLVSWWPIVVNVAGHVMLGMCVGLLGAWLLRIPSHLRMHFVLMSGVGNLGNFPLVLVPAIAAQTTLFTAAERQMAAPYVFAGLLAVSIAQFSVARSLLQPRQAKLNSEQGPGAMADEMVSGQETPCRAEEPSEAVQDNGLSDNCTSAPDTAAATNHEQCNDRDPDSAVSVAERGARRSCSSRSIAVDVAPGKNTVVRWSDAAAEDPAAPADGKATKPPAKSGCWQGCLRFRPLKRVGGVLYMVYTLVCNPPTVAIVVACTVGLTPQLRALFFSEDGTERPSVQDTPLTVLTQTMDSLGGAMVPTLLVGLGASLLNGPVSDKVPWRMSLTLVCIRLVVLPCLGGFLVLLTKAWGWWHPADKMMTFVMLMQHSMPTAINMHTIASLLNNHADEVATMLFWQYPSSAVTIPVCVASYLYLLRRAV